MWMVESSFVLQSIQKVYDDWFVAAWKKSHFFQIQLVNLQVDHDLQQNYIIAVVWCFLNSSRPNFIFANSNAGPIDRGLQVQFL